MGSKRSWVAILSLVWAAAPVAAQRFGVRREPEVHNLPYDGRFTFARLKFETPPAGYYYGGLPAWAHGYPRAELNLMRILNEVSLVRPQLEGSNVFAPDDPALGRYPVAYMSEAGFWTMTEKEVAGLRQYLLKGGFLIFDDFRDDWYRGGGGWENFATQMRRVIPNAQFVDLTIDHPIFHSFYEINSTEDIPQFYDRGAPMLRGLFLDNDPSKRMLAMINFNTDVSNFWEFSADAIVPIDLSNEGYKLGVNYIVYALTH